MKGFGEWLSERRKSRQWSQDELASRIGTSTRTVVRWESEEGKPTRHAARRIAQLFGTEEDETIRAARSGGRPAADDGAKEPGGLEVSFAARQCLAAYATDAGMKSPGQWVSYFCDWLEAAPSPLRRFVLDSVRDGFNPPADAVIGGDAPTRPSGATAGKKP